jgi:CRP-like cAMP-binding protein
MTRNVQRDLLRPVWLFAECSHKELDAIAKVATPLDVPAGTTLTKQNEVGREFFVVVHGSVEACRDTVVLGELKPGDCFGEMSLLEALPRVATVTATTPTTVLVIHARDFKQVVTAVPSIDRKMLLVLARRLREIETRFVPHRNEVETNIAPPRIQGTHGYEIMSPLRLLLADQSAAIRRS